jgi:DNA recombination protein Rad52
MNFSALEETLDPKNVRSRKQGNIEVSYIEGWHAIAEANRIFGFDGWSRNTIDINCVSTQERKIGQKQIPGWGVTYIARVRILVTHDGKEIIRDGCGSGHGIDKDLGQAHESAIKEAETDAMKRAFMTFGNPFGLALYDKEQKEVVRPQADIQADMINAISKAPTLTKFNEIKTSHKFKEDFKALSDEGKLAIKMAGEAKAATFAAAA